jgi:3-oxoacyl-[acyl-carrier protein] reductase
VVTQIRGMRVLITGAANGIGKATAAMFQDAGARVAGLDLEESAGAARIFQCDLAREDDIISGVSKVVRELGGVDVLVNNAGIMREAPIASIDAGHIDRMFAVNIRGTILVTRETLTHLGDGARIINIASELAYLGRANASVYCATKAAILGLTRSWARELAPRILVNAVAPGPTDTGLLAFESLTPEQRALETAHPLGRVARPEEIASAILFLAGPGATFFTGQCMGANGGAAMT